MFGPEMKVFSWAKVIGGMSKTLGVVNQIIPIYKSAKPMIQNARSAFKVVKEFGNNSVNKIMINKEKNIKPIKEKINTTHNVNFTPNSNNNPKFFQ